VVPRARLPPARPGVPTRDHAEEDGGVEIPRQWIRVRSRPRRTMLRLTSLQRARGPMRAAKTTESTAAPAALPTTRGRQSQFRFGADQPRALFRCREGVWPPQVRRAGRASARSKTPECQLRGTGSYESPAASPDIAAHEPTARRWANRCGRAAEGRWDRRAAPYCAVESRARRFRFWCGTSPPRAASRRRERV